MQLKRIIKSLDQHNNNFISQSKPYICSVFSVLRKYVKNIKINPI